MDPKFVVKKGGTGVDAALIAAAGYWLKRCRTAQVPDRRSIDKDS